MGGGPRAWVIGCVSLVTESDVAYIILNGPSGANVLSKAMSYDLGHVLDDLTFRKTIRFLVLSGAGTNFSSGADLGELSDGLPANYLEDYLFRMERTIIRLRSMNQIVITSLKGAAVGTGAALALAADFVVADPGARLRFNFANLGLLPGAGCVSSLVRLAGPAVARDLLMTGRWVTANEARDLRLIHRVGDDVESEVNDLIRQLRQVPVATLSLTKALIDSIAFDKHTESVHMEGAYQVAATAANEYSSRARTALHALHKKPLNDPDAGGLQN